MSFFRNLFWFIVLISPLVIIHEFAHLVLGKMMGLNPEVFSIGFGPVLFSVEWQNISWQIAAIPLGGYVMFPQESMLGLGSGDPWSWFFVALVGPLSNFLTAVFLIYGFFLKLYSNFEMVKAEGEVFFVGRFKEDSFFSYKISHEYYKFHNANFETLSLMEAFNYKIESRKQKLSFKDYWKMALINSGQLLFSRKEHPELVKLLKQVSLSSSPSETSHGFIGPIGIAKMLGEAVNQSWARVTLLSASLSVSLGVFNLLPLGILDGGKALQALMQIMFGPSQIATVVYQLVSLVIFLLMISAALYGDLWAIFRRKK
jgi:regulator of sigma E protease